jgi:hypothetical protein
MLHVNAPPPKDDRPSHQPMARNRTRRIGCVDMGRYACRAPSRRRCRLRMGVASPLVPFYLVIDYSTLRAIGSWPQASPARGRLAVCQAAASSPPNSKRATGPALGRCPNLRSKVRLPEISMAASWWLFRSVTPEEIRRPTGAVGGERHQETPRPRRPFRLGSMPASPGNPSSNSGYKVCMMRPDPSRLRPTLASTAPALPPSHGPRCCPSGLPEMTMQPFTRPWAGVARREQRGECCALPAYLARRSNRAKRGGGQAHLGPIAPALPFVENGAEAVLAWHRPNGKFHVHRPWLDIYIPRPTLTACLTGTRLFA